MSSYVITYNGNWGTFGGNVSTYEPPYAPTKPYLVFRFTDPTVVPTSSSVLNSTGDWNRVPDATNNDWYWERYYFNDIGTGSYDLGWPAAFSGTGASPVGKLTSQYACYIVGYGNLTATQNSLVTLDRMFMNCDGLLGSTVVIQTPNTLNNVGGMFSGCTNIEEGMLDQYTYWSTYNNISNHSGTFTNAGADTTTGLAELDQIPVGWGGNYTPSSTLMESYRTQWKSRYDTWEIEDNYPTWASVVPNHMYLLTTSSVSAYAGVSMNRTRISKRNNLDVSNTAELYFYPCFMQHSSSAITWAVVTANPNGSLASGQGSTDMPGTLDYSAIGPFTYEYGTLDSGSVYFGFLATNVPIASWNGMTDPYGVLYNGNFKTDAGLRWFF